ncbi:hypothetical protein NK6_2473 [Bradyrhizobium diazoefficiens]|uniref:Uncharacterized protein n=1 Tax=Bradyrhizobium diazoefficiens TaxID=1355477 RepID=A0A0E4BMQ7_9BRAD|nr:hypothetical protein NK6_2473 [Bradyrhizobium diazoefficiens]
MKRWLALESGVEHQPWSGWRRFPSAKWPLPTVLQ